MQHYKDYIIDFYQPKYREEVIALEKYLWGMNTELNQKYFKWKFEKNPFTSRTLAAVALYDGRVIGFDGLLPQRWILKGGNSSKTVHSLQTCDACIESLHRNEGIHKAMNRFISKYFWYKKYELLLQFSGNKVTSKNVLKLGWKPITQKKYFYIYHFINLCKLLRVNMTKQFVNDIPIHDENFSNIELTWNNKPKAMSQLNKKILYTENIIALDKTEEYLSWRFVNPRSKYFFVYQWNDKRDRLVNYLVFKIAKNNQLNRIVDFGITDLDQVKYLFKFIAKHKYFEKIMILNPNDGFDQFNFIKKRPFFDPYRYYFAYKEKLEGHGKRYILVNTIKLNQSTLNCFLTKKDIQNADNWFFLDICADNI